MSNIRTKEPASELQRKIQQARDNIRTKSQRRIRCPHCDHIAMVVYANATGYVETKCGKCKRAILIDLVSMRRIRRHSF
ncbi:hypothetical protein RFF05_15940 [Bengtsoniella intestinalis]|uniref:hypothetical protein n=1 Tax=Bengtsoniella intestinalis TaxID=3073143 RepID=UPI00391F190D